MRPMRAARLLFVTGKGGVGKTTVAAALGHYVATSCHRGLIVETASDGRLAHLFGHRSLSAEPRRLRASLDAVRVDGRQLVEEYFARMLRFQVLSQRLLSSETFNALTAAVPGITEFLLLEKLLDWIEPGFSVRRRGYEVIIVDGPATGHALKLLRTPRALATMVPGGPLGTTARRLLTLLGDHRRTQVLLVSLPDEMSVRETIETQQALEGDLAIHVARPVINRIFPRHFSGAEAQRIERHGKTRDPGARALLEAARFSIACRREAERHVAHLRRALGVRPMLLHQFFTGAVHAEDLEAFGRTLGKAVLDPAGDDRGAKAKRPSWDASAPADARARDPVTTDDADDDD
jgi:anion-transporting  ArsA/GET3 family ATPase